MIIITNMTITDFELIKDHLIEDFDDFWTPQTLKNELENESSKYIVAKASEQIVGFAGIWKAYDNIHITNIVVRKDCRLHGIGKLLLEKLIQISKKQNISSITLEVNKTNRIAIQLYSEYGFKETGLRKNYYNGISDALIMTLQI